MDIERKDNVYKVSMPAITDDEIRAIDNNFDEIARQFSEMIIHDKDLIVAQRVIQNLRAEIEKKDKIIDKLLTEITAVNSGRYEYMDNDRVLEIFTNKVEESD